MKPQKQEVMKNTGKFFGLNSIAERQLKWQLNCKKRRNLEKVGLETFDGTTDEEAASAPTVE